MSATVAEVRVHWRVQSHSSGLPDTRNTEPTPSHYTETSTLENVTEGGEESDNKINFKHVKTL